MIRLVSVSNYALLYRRFLSGGLFFVSTLHSKIAPVYAVARNNRWENGNVLVYIIMLFARKVKRSLPFVIIFCCFEC